MYTPSSIVPTLTVAVAILSVNKLNDGCQCNDEFYIVSTLTVVVATLSINKMKLMVGNVNSMFIVSTLPVAVATLSVNKLNDGWQCIHQVLYSVDTNGGSRNA